MTAHISQYVLKVSSRCDLACDHCYVYEHADQSWQRKPKSIAADTATQAAWRIAEHARRHDLPRVTVVLHGGEPLLLGHAGLRPILHALWSAITPVAGLSLVIHTNGIRLDKPICDLFAAYGTSIGISLDGDRTANDRHRRYADGRGSHDLVLRALSLIRGDEYRLLYGGILCTIDLANDPIAVYEALIAEQPPRLDLLLPHATWDSPPATRARPGTPYADWLGQVHARWTRDGRPVPIRIFESLAAAWAGRPSGSEAAGLDPVDLLVIDTDGSWEQADSLKTAYDGAPATGFDVFSHSVDDVAAHPMMAARQAGIAGLCPTCQQCELVRACGGGLYAHRYRTGAGFANPSVYCGDLKKLIPRVVAVVPRVAAASVTATPAGHLLPRHELDNEAFTALAAGPGSAAAMAALAESRWSVNRALVAAVAASLDRGTLLRRAATEGWRNLLVLDREHPQAVREILTYPCVQAWAARCLRPAEGRDADLDLAHLTGLAAAAALRAGVEAELPLAVRNGTVYLPSVGAFLPGDTTAPVVMVRTTPDGITPRQGTLRCQPIWQVATGTWSVSLDDVDPFRQCGSWTSTGRLTPAAWQRWQGAITTAAERLGAEVPGYAEVIGLGLRALVPIHPVSTGLRHSATSRDAFGALAVALPDDEDSLDELLLHEMQHLKLAAIADLYELFDPADQQLYPVPWRPDRRPIGGVLHGTYAHLALAELWLSRTIRDPAPATRQRFVLYRNWVERALATVQVAGNLRPAGLRLVAGMCSAVEAWSHAQ
jgi:uncharacterized protein